MRVSMVWPRWLFVLAMLLPTASALIGVGSSSVSATAIIQYELANPAAGQPGSQFGYSVTVLPGGNIVVTDPSYDAGATANVGAVYLFNGTTRALISTLTGSSRDDSVGVGGVVLLSNGNFLVGSSSWRNGPALSAGAVTWGSGATGVSGVVGPANSLVGTSVADRIDTFGKVVELPNGNYLVRSPAWDNGPAIDAGAVTWGNGETGISGVVSAANSLVGSTSQDRIGKYDVTVLSNGNYVVPSPFWSNGSAVGAGAVTWGNGATGTTGVVGVARSLVGTTADDNVGGVRVVALSNGNYVVNSSLWDNGLVANVGAITWANGATGLSGVVSGGNSLVGSHSDDYVGYGVNSLVTLSNGNYVVRSSSWDNGLVVDAGAVTWGNGVTGTSGIVGAANSLVGSTSFDYLGSFDVAALLNGNYVVVSSAWDSGLVVDAGAVTWGDGATGSAGVVGVANSLVGATADDRAGSYGVAILSNGNYVFSSPSWDNGSVSDAGAVTWASGSRASSGLVSAANSLIGAQAFDKVGSLVTTALSNGNYVVDSPFWANGSAYGAGAITWGSGAIGTTGVVSAVNSLVGSSTHDYVGNYGIIALSNGNYVVSSPNWSNGQAPDAGAVTWGNGVTGSSGAVGMANSLVGGHSQDSVGGVTPLPNGNYVVSSPGWDNGAVMNAGAFTWGNGLTGASGLIGVANSMVGITRDDKVGSAILVLSNGNYVISSPDWSNDPVFGVGAVTWGDGARAAAGVVSAANSLVGTTNYDHVGGSSVDAVVANADGSYLVSSGVWDNGAVGNAGALTYGPATGIHGSVTPTNSLVGASRVVSRVARGRTTAGAYAVSNGQGRVFLVLPGLDWVDNVLAEFHVGRGYADGVLATGSPQATYSVSAGALPAGVSINASTGGITGTPTTAGAYGFTITASNADGSSISAAFSGTVGIATDFVPLAPERLADTRPTGATVDKMFAASGERAADSTMELTVASRGGVLANAQAVSLNITAVDAAADGFATVFPCGSAKPNASNLNYVAGRTRANAVITKVGAGGKVCIYVSSATQLIVDVNGSFPASSHLVSANPARVLDTRPSGETVDNLERAGGLRAVESITTVPIAGRANVPTNAKAVIVNVTATGPTSDGYLTVYPCGAPVPNASNLNYTSGASIANLVVSKLGAAGALCIKTSAATHLIADVTGYFPAGSSYEALQPARLLDTRGSGTTIDNLFTAAGLRPFGTITELPVTGRGGVSANAATVVLNITATGPIEDGFVSVYPCGISPPNASNLNFATSRDVANTVIVKPGAGGKVCLYNSGQTHLVADVSGYLPG
jgi:Repeat of unknown function (DUF5650)/Putative Ig domain